MFIVNPNTYIPKAATKNETGIPKAVIKATLEFKNKYKDRKLKNKDKIEIVQFIGGG